MINASSFLGRGRLWLFLPSPPSEYFVFAIIKDLTHFPTSPSQSGLYIVCRNPHMLGVRRSTSCSVPDQNSWARKMDFNLQERNWVQVYGVSENMNIFFLCKFGA